MGALLEIGAVRQAAFSPENLASPAIRAMMPRVSVSLDPGLAQAYPRQRAANLTVTLRDNRTLTQYQPTRKGDPDMPLSDGELSEKFTELAAPVLGNLPAAALLERLWQGHSLP